MLIRSSLLYIASKLVPGAFGVVTTSILTHVMSPERYGVYGLALLIMTFGSSMFFDWLGLSFMRLYEARKHDRRTIPTFIAMFAMVLVGTLLIGLASIATGLIAHDEFEICLAGLFMTWAYSFFELIARFEIADFHPVRYLAMNIGRAILMLAFTASAAWLTHDPLKTALATATALTLAALAGGWRRLNVSHLLIDWSLVRATLHFGLPYIISMTMAGLVTSGVRALVGMLAGTRELGLYTAAFSLSQNTLTLVAAGIGAATYPLAVQAVERRSAEAAEAQMIANGTILLAVLAPASAGLAVTAPDVAAFLVGRVFRPTVQLLIPWMALASFMAGFRACYLDHAFQLSKKSIGQVWVSLDAAVVSVAGAWILIPRLGVVGAAIATAVSMFVSCIHAWIAGRSAYRLPLPIYPALRVALCCALMAIVVYLGPRAGVDGLVPKIILGASVYLAGAWATNLLDTKVIIQRALVRVFRRKPRKLTMLG